jgi:hypothetical protein
MSIVAQYFVLAGNADTSAAVVGTVIFIVLFVLSFAVKLSTSVQFFCILIVALFGIVSVALIVFQSAAICIFVPAITGSCFPLRSVLRLVESAKSLISKSPAT